MRSDHEYFAVGEFQTEAGCAVGKPGFVGRFVAQGSLGGIEGDRFPMEWISAREMRRLREDACAQDSLGASVAVRDDGDQTYRDEANVDQPEEDCPEDHVAV